MRADPPSLNPAGEAGVAMCDVALLCPPYRWMEACLDEELPPTTELEEGLRNGVYLAKLGNFFAPRTVSLKKIYDREQTRYKVKPCGATSLWAEVWDSQTQSHRSYNI